MFEFYKHAAKTVILLSFSGLYAGAVVNVSFSSGTESAALEKTFISNTTGQYLSTLTPSPYFAGTYSLVIRGLNAAYVPPVISSPIVTATAVDQLLAWGVGNGMDYERFANVNLIRSVQGVDLSSGTCGRDYIGFSSSTVSVSTTTAFYQCVNAYNVMVSTIQERWQYIYDSKGNKVAP